jgi:hypothetical protein
MFLFYYGQKCASNLAIETNENTLAPAECGDNLHSSRGVT